MFPGEVVNIVCFTDAPLVQWSFSGGKVGPNVFVNHPKVKGFIHGLKIITMDESNVGVYVCTGQDSTNNKYLFFNSVAVVKLKKALKSKYFHSFKKSFFSNHFLGGTA